MIDLLIYEITEIENLPLRTNKICKQLGINSLNDLLNYYNENKTFLKANVCGKKTNQDLINIYKKYNRDAVVNGEKKTLPELNSIHEDDKYFSSIKTIAQKIKQLTNQQKAIINNKIIVKTSHLSARGFNALKVLLQGNYSIDNLYNYVLSDRYFNFINVRNVGKSTIPELENFIKEVKDELDKLIKLNKSKVYGHENLITQNEKLNIEFALSTLQKYFGIKETDFEPLSSSYIKNKSFPLFKMLNFLIQGKYIFNNIELMVFNNAVSFTTFQSQTVQEISAIVGLTGERVRQLKFIILNNFDSTFNFITKFDQIIKYNIFDYSKSFIHIDDEAADNLNSNEDVHFSKLFYIKIFALFAQKTHTLIGNISVNITEPKVKKIINNEYFLISKQYTDIFDFNALIKDIFKQIYKRKTKTCIYNFENYISQFYYLFKKTDNNKISEICRKIVQNNFNLTVDFQGNFTFQRNTKKLTYEYLIDILEDFKRPMHFVELYKECVKRAYPIKSDMGVHSTLINHSDIFGLKGAGTFNLRKFGGYFGTIGNVAEKFIKEKDAPVHLYELEKFINRELIISKYSIRMVLFKYKHEDRFILDKDNFVSLREWVDDRKN